MRVHFAALILLAALPVPRAQGPELPAAPKATAQQQKRQVIREPIPPAPGDALFQNRLRSFQVHLPKDWRQLAPAEVRPVREACKDMPYDLRQNEPALFYGVGPVDRWHAGEFDGTYLYVVEQDAEWHLDGDLRERLQHMWDHKGERDGHRYTVVRAEKAEVGFDAYAAVVAERRIEPAVGRVQRSLDVHVPTGGREVTLCFTCWDDEWATREPELRRRIATLSFARPARGEVTLSDRLWTPILLGAGVGLVLVVLYKRNRRPPL